MFTSTPYKGLFSSHHPPTSEDSEIIEKFVGSSHQIFLDQMLFTKSNLNPHIKKIDDGRIVNGTEAVELGLANHIGWLYTLIRHQGLLDSNSNIFDPFYINGPAQAETADRNSPVDMISKFI